MSDQLQELLQRIYNDGVKKAQEEAQEIREAAETQAKDLIDKAKTEAEEIVASARKAADDLRLNTDSDIKLGAQHTLSVIKQKVTEVLLNSAIEKPIKESFQNPQFLQDLILEVVKAWHNSPDTIRLILPEQLQQQLDDLLQQSIPGVMGDKIKVDFSPLMKDGFTIEPMDGTYKLSFTDDDFVNLFRSYLRPRTAKLLFTE